MLMLEINNWLVDESKRDYENLITYENEGNT